MKKLGRYERIALKQSDTGSMRCGYRGRQMKPVVSQGTLGHLRAPMLPWFPYSCNFPYHGSVLASPRREVKDVAHKDTYSYKQGGSAPPAIETGG